MDILETGGISLPEDLYGVAILTQYAVRTRYPAMVEPITPNEYEAAVELAVRVIEWVEKTLGQVKK
jgi:HEPN domain-containing protein